LGSRSQRLHSYLFKQFLPKVEYASSLVLLVLLWVSYIALSIWRINSADAEVVMLPMIGLAACALVTCIAMECVLRSVGHRPEPALPQRTRVSCELRSSQSTNELWVSQTPVARPNEPQVVEKLPPESKEPATYGRPMGSTLDARSRLHAELAAADGELLPRSSERLARQQLTIRELRPELPVALELEQRSVRQKEQGNDHKEKKEKKEKKDKREVKERRDRGVQAHETAL